MSAIVKQEIDFDVFSVLQNSLYPGAKKESIEMIIEHCKASKIDPLLKPFHIVPMSVKDAKTGKYEYRDTIMPGVGLYRIMAERSGAYAGISEPKFGPMITESLGNVTICYPEWCSITVRRIVQGHVVEFSAKEYWIENYATQGKDSLAPNKIWIKRKYGQLAKCTESQALRRAFPDIIPQQPTAEEMDGKTFLPNENKSVKNVVGVVYDVKQKSDGLCETDKPNDLVFSDKINIEAGEIIENDIKMENSEDLHTKMMNLLIRKDVQRDEVNKWMEKAGISSLHEFNKEQREKIISMLEKRNDT
jgi:phage recombination protein Bet